MGVYIIHASHECVIPKKCGHRLFSEANRVFSYDELQQQIRDVFELPSTAPFLLRYKDHNSDSVSLVNDMEIHDAFCRQGINPLGVTVLQKCSSPIVKVVHRDTHHLLTLPPRQLEICYEQFHARVRDLLKLQASAPFLFSYKEPDFCGPNMTVANDEEFKYALVKASPHHLQLDISIIEEHYEPDLSCYPSVRETPSDVVKILHNDILLGLTLSPDELESSCEQFQSRIRDVFKLPTQSVLNYVDKDWDTIVITKSEKLKDTLLRQPGRPLRLDTAYSSVVRRASYVVKVEHNGTLRRLSLPPGQVQFSYEEFRSRIRGLFKLPPYTMFELRYIDQDLDNITMSEDEDLRDALMMQSLHPLKVNMVIIEGEGPRRS